MSTATATYRIRIATPGATVVEGNVALTLTMADVTAVPLLAGPAVEPLAGNTVSMSFTVPCIVDSVLFTSSGRLTGIGRLCEIQRDVGAGFVEIGTGRIAAMHETERGLIEVQVSDERWIERNTEIFRTTTSVQLHPAGLAFAWNGEPAAGETGYRVNEIVGDAVRIGVRDDVSFDELAPLTVPLGLMNALASDLLPARDLDASSTNSAGNFTNLRFRYQLQDRRVISFRQNLGGETGGLSDVGLLGTLAVRGPSAGTFSHAWVYIASHSLTVGDIITGRFYWPAGVAVSEHVPLHLGGDAGVHPMTLLRDILDGVYGGGAVRYNSAAMDALEALSMRPVWARVTAPTNRAKWVEPNLFAPFAALPLVGTDLVLRPMSLRQPQNEDPDTYTVLDASNSSGLTWRHLSRDMVTVVAWKSRRLIRLDPDMRTEAADGLATEDYPLPAIEHANAATLGDVVRQINTELIFEEGREIDVATELAGELFQVFSDGPVRGYVTVPDDAGVQVGDDVVLDHDTLKGFNPGSGDRTGERVVQLLTFTELAPAHTTFEWLDKGPKSQALAAPTVSIAQDGTDLGLVNVTISNLPSGATAVVEVEIAASPPTTFGQALSEVGNETVSFRINAVEGTAYCRARSVQDGRISSAWATDDVALTASPRITAAINRVGAGATVTWTELSNTAGVRAEVAIHALNAAPSYGAPTDYDVADGGFTVPEFSLRNAVTVRLTPYSGFSAGAVSGNAGPAVVLSAWRPRTVRDPLGRPTLRPDATHRGRVTGIAVTFDANGEAVVSASGSSLTTRLLVTVGDGTTPADPTDGANDGVISGESGTVSTGVKITTGNEAIVKVVAEDDLGELGDVVTVRQGRRVGPFAKDTAATTTSGTTETTLTTITVPANRLGLNGSLRVTAVFFASGSAGNKHHRIDWGGTTLINHITPNAGYHWIDVILFNQNSASSQRLTSRFTEDTNVDVDQNEAIEDTTADVDLVFTGQCTDAADSIELSGVLAVYEGTE